MYTVFLNSVFQNQKVVKKEIEKVKELGVKFETNVVIGKSTTIDQLMEEEDFEAVFIGSGAGLPMSWESLARQPTEYSLQMNT